MQDLNYILQFNIQYFMQSYTSNTILTSEQSAQLELFISARSLYDMDIFSKSDPYVKVYSKRMNNQWVLLGRTQTIDNNLNPNFQKSFIMNYVFQARQDLKFQVMDEDDKSNSSNDDFIGTVETSLGACAGAKDQTLILPLKNTTKPNVGKIILRVEPVNSNNNYLRMEWSARALMNTDSWFDWWDKSDPYLKFMKIRQDNTLVEAARTPVVMNNLNPNWPMIEVAVGKLVRADNAQQKFKIQCWDWQEAGEAKHQFIGEAYVKLSDLLSAKKGAPQLLMDIKLFNPKHKNPGSIVLKKCEQFQKPTFINYLRGGLQINLSVAIDFTGSNGVVNNPSSLHYLNQYNLNNYQQAIMAIGSILLNYDYDKRIPAFGFGAKLKFPMMRTNMVSHCFPLSGNPQQIEAFGLEGLMMMYRNAQTQVQLSGPTYFAPIIKQFVDLAYQSHQEGSYCYQVLLILTDGAIHDMDQTVNLLVSNCKLPLSIIIVGIGNADFSNMNTLDGDNGLYNSLGVKAARDIVQFVPFNEVQMNPDLLAKQLLAQLPDQVVQYMTMMGKLPNPPQEVNMQALMMDNQNVESIEAGLKQNLPQLFANLTVKPEG